MKHDVYKLKVMESAEHADVFLYGVIGPDWMKPSDQQNTDEVVVMELERLAEKFGRINLRINSPGGSMLHGNAIVSAIQRSKAEIHAYCDGVAASMAADIFMAAPHRHMAKASLLMVHKAHDGCWGDDEAMEACARTLRKFNDTAIGVMSECTGKTEEEIKTAYYDGADHWLSRKDCLALGIVNEEADDYDAAAPPKDIEKMAYPELLAAFQEKNGQQRPQNWLSKITAAYWAAQKSADRMDTPPIVHNPTQKDMSIQAIQAALADGSLNADDLRALLPAKAATPPSAEGPAPAPVSDPMKAIDDRIAAMEDMVAKFAAAPGAGRSAAAFPAGGDDDDESRDPLKAMNDGLYESRDHQQRFVAT